VGALSIFLSGLSFAQPYPSKPVRMIIPFPAGGGVDTIGRVVAEKLASALGQPVVPENRGGAAGVIGMRVAAKAPGDGYTLVMTTTGTVAINPTLYAEPGYDPKRDFTPVGLIASTPIVIMAHPSFAPKTIAEIIALARAQPGKLNIGTPPPGTSNHLAAELFKRTAQIDVTIVTYKGTGPLTTDLLGGHVGVAFNVLAPAMTNLKSGSLRAIATLGPTRSSVLPDVPTAAESGLPGSEAVLHYGLLAPAGTPGAIVARLNAELRAAIDTTEVKSRIAADGSEPLPSTPDEFARDIAREAAKWSALIAKLGLPKQ